MKRTEFSKRAKLFFRHGLVKAHGATYGIQSILEALRYCSVRHEVAAPAVGATEDTFLANRQFSAHRTLLPGTAWKVSTKRIILRALQLESGELDGL